MGSQATSLECEAAERVKSNLWTTILDITDLRAGIDSTRHNYFRIACREYFTHIRLNMFPDGGIARLRVYGNVIPDFSLLKSPCDLAVLCNG
jgi:allantoicase